MVSRDVDDDYQAVYKWVDEIPLTRPKKNISRDFADGVLLAEVLHHFCPRLVEMHNYSAANSYAQKSYNWATLNNKVMRKLGIQLQQQDIEDIIKAVPGAIEAALKTVMDRLAKNHNRAVSSGRSSRCDTRTPSVSSDSRVRTSGSGSGSLGSELRRDQDICLPPLGMQKYQREVDTELLLEKERIITELRERLVIMTEKNKRLEQLVQIKDSKIEALSQKLHARRLD